MLFRLLLVFSLLFGSVVLIKSSLARVPASQSVGRNSPEMVAFLKKQACERKTFIEEQSGKLTDLKIRHQNDRKALLEKHRKARAEFSAIKHSIEERTVFFKAEREEMNNLMKHQKDERKQKKLEFNQAIDDFFKKQKEQTKEFLSG